MTRGRAAHQRMVLSNVRLVASIAKEYRWRSSLDMADLMQEGLVGLMRAAERFDVSWGTRFSTYASYWIKQALGRAIDDTAHTIRIPVHMMERVKKLRRALGRMRATSTREPTVEAIAEALGWDKEETEKALAAHHIATVSIDDEGDDDTRRAPLVIVDMGPTPEEALEHLELQELLDEVLATLPEREATIIRRRFGFDNENGAEETLEQIGTDYGVTRERIRQIEAKALRRLRHPARSRRLKSYSEQG
jgi:RNA polymerase primary sigma factor